MDRSRWSIPSILSLKTTCSSSLMSQVEILLTDRVNRRREGKRNDPRAGYIYFFFWGGGGYGFIYTLLYDGSVSSRWYDFLDNFFKILCSFKHHVVLTSVTLSAYISVPVLFYGWRNWDDFNYKTLMSLYGYVLNKSCPPRNPPWTSVTFGAQVITEDSLEYFISSFNILSINETLDVACRALDLEPIHVMRGSYCQEGPSRSNWALIRPSRVDENGCY